MAIFENLEYKRVRQINPEKLSPLAGVITKVSKINKNPNALKVRYFEKLLNFIRVLCLHIIDKNDFIETMKIKNLSKEKGSNNRIVESFVDLLFHFNILGSYNGEIAFNKKYVRILKSENKLIDKLFKQDILDKNLKVNDLTKDYLFVKDLIRKYRDKGYEFQYIKRNKDTWSSMLKDGALDYEVRLAETLHELSQLDIPNKIKSPFDEDYYTESGRNAFKNFTQFKFIDVFAETVQNQHNANVLDIGCGYGNYIDVLSNNYPMFQIDGIESQQNVFEETSRKFGQDGNVEIIHGDFFNYRFRKKYDVVLLNYVLFYFNAHEKSELISKVKEILTENGSVIVCQYFSGIEDLKKELANKQKERSPFKEIEMYYSNKILYANTLWNDTADTFSESVKWEEFLEVISKNNLKINRITNADKFYYSLFIELKTV